MPSPSKTAQFKQQDQQPWYKNYMVVVFVIGLPLFVVIACLWLVYYSIKIQDSVVRDDWYMDGKTLYQDVSRDKLAYDLSLQGDMVFEDNGQVIFHLIYPSSSLSSGKLAEGTPVYYPEELNLSISHATDINKDRDAILVHQTGDTYTANINLDDLKSKYYVQVSNEGKLNWRLRNVGQLPNTHITFEPLISFAQE